MELVITYESVSWTDYIPAVLVGFNIGALTAITIIPLKWVN